MRKGLIGLPIVALFAFLAVMTFGIKESVAAEGDYKDTMILVTAVETSTLDPRMGNSAQNSIPMEFIYDNLVKLDRDTGDVIPVLAVSWDFIDPTHLRMNLRKDVKFSNGDPFTAEDVYYCFRRAKDHSTSKSTMSWLDIENTKVIDDHTIILAMYAPYSPVFYVLANGRTYIASKKAMEAMGEDAHARNPVGTGPYKLVEWKSGTSMSFTRNENYWDTPAVTKNLILNIVPEASGRVIELETGNADFAYYIEASDIARVKSIEGFHIEQGDTERYFLVTLSMEEPLFQKKEVRYALSLAIDKPALVDACFDGAANVLTGIYSPIILGFKEYGVMPYDVEKAKQLLAEAGYPDGFKIELHVLPTTQFQRLAEAVQAMWAQIGVQAEIVTSELATYEAQKGGKFQAAIRDGNAAEVSNILIIYEISFGSRLQPNDKVLDGMLQEVKTIYDKETKIKKLHEIEDYIYDMRYSIPFATVPAIYGVSDKLEGFKFNIPYELRVAKWGIKK
ncbi:MAG: ABC transporter substrate-binding protein [Synergistaceae bacterium]|jgi:peptide/nickel transport system substrate-binding protein|nr:ABC transporter substrate-binding protein [Synergistaceae bacterium]